MQPQPGVRITVVSREVLTPYSGMLPGHVAGSYDWRDIHIDLGPLARFAGARLIEDEAIALDPQRRRIQLQGHPELRFDLLSINTGAVPEQTTGYGVPVKPIGRFLPQWQRVRQTLTPGARVGLVGGGAGGVELALAMRRVLPASNAVLLFTERVLPGGSERLRRATLRVLARAGIELLQDFRVVAAGPGAVTAADGRVVSVDHLFWVTRVAAPDWPAAAGLATDDLGFIAVDRQLRSVSHPEVFAAGDIAALQGQNRPKAGVYAVREGPILADNLRRALRGERLREFRAQRRFLAILGTGDDRAIASRGAWVLEGAWVWRWKDWIDQRFMARFRELPAMPDAAGRRPEPLPAALANDAPDLERFGGCGAKIGASPLRRVLARLPDQTRPEVPVGIGDDAAVLMVPGERILLTVDGFRSLIDDAYQFGRITAHHSLNDVLAMGGRGIAALAMATVPLMAEAMMEEELYWLLRGAVDVLNAHDVPLVGGHSAEGAELSLALTITGVETGATLGQAGLQPGDRLILNKPLGTGVLLAGHMRGLAASDQVSAALRQMDTSNAPALAVLRRFDVHALTDVTGFGLLGHLGEMLRASGVGVNLAIGAMPALAGALALIEAGVVSSLHANNAQAIRDFTLSGQQPDSGAVKLLVDPQTSGGLLAGVPGDRAADCVAALQAAGYPDASLVGEVTAGGWVLHG